MLVLSLLNRVFKKTVPVVKFPLIDGLRGYLAFFVFLHHSCIYYFALRSYNWELPRSKIYLHFGSTSVALFFMITAFLFITKLIDKYGKETDWLKFFVSRILRLYPLYLVALALSFLFACIVSKFTVKEPLSALAGEFGHWLLFSVFSHPNINGVIDTSSFMIGVLWSLKYEWVFYLLLPVAALLFFRSNVSTVTLVITLQIVFLITILTNVEAESFIVCSGGVLAAFAARNKTFCKWASHWISSIITIACLALTVAFFNDLKQALPLLLVSTSFILIACGNSLFGLLNLRVSRELGQLSYGIYLMHGLFLYALFHFLIGDRHHSTLLSSLQHWLLISALGGVLTICCFFLHHYLEAPAMRSSQIVTNFLREQRLRLKGSAPRQKGA